MKRHFSRQQKVAPTRRKATRATVAEQNPRRATTVMLAAIALLIALAVGQTLAYIFDKTDPVANTFEVGDITYTLTLKADLPEGTNAAELQMTTLDATGDQTNSKSVAAGHANFTLSGDPALTGYQFLGWYAEGEDAPMHAPGTKAIAVGYGDPHTETAPDGASISLTLHAKWKPITYKINYHGNGNTGGSMVSSTHTYNVESNLTKNAYEKSDYKFEGWSTEQDGPVIYSDQHAVLNLASEDGDEINLYAQWIPSTQYVITYNANATDASFTSGTQAYTDAKLHDTVYTVKTPDGIGVTRNNYWIWTEWNTKADGTGTTYLGGNSYTENADLTLYAIWKPRTDVKFGPTDYVNMKDPSSTFQEGKYSFTVKCQTQGGADGIATPMYNLIPGQAYKLTFSVDFEISDFYTEDNHGYMFGTTIIDQYKNYHTSLSIIARDNVKKTSTYENMMWSTESAGRYDMFIEFVPTAETMYWFWETTDITDHVTMTYNFNNFSIQMIDKPAPRVEFEKLYVTYETAPSLENTVWTEGWEDKPRHKNYFHTEKYDFDSLTYRRWGTDGHERLTIPITGLTVGQEYELSFNQDLSRAQTYNTNKNSLNSTQLYGTAVTEAETLGSNELNSGNGVHNQANYQDLRKAKVGAVSNQSIKFTATAETMYWQWTLGDLVDGASGSKVYSWVNLTNVSVTPTSSAASLDLAAEPEASSIALDWSGIDDVNMEAWYPVDEQSPIAGHDYELSFVALDGYTMTDVITVSVDDVSYVVYTDGREMPDGSPYFDPVTGILAIPGTLLTDQTKAIAITASAVALGD